jgi:hypothetical protein
MFETIDFSLIPGDQRGRRGWRRGLVTQQAMAIPELQRRYIVRLGQLLNEVFTVENVNRIISDAETRVRTQVGTEEPRLATYLSGQARYMRQRIASRIQAARTQYLGLSKMLTPQ